MGIDSVVALDDRTLSVTLRATPDSAPHLFADPALAVPIASGSVPIVDFQVAPGGDPRDALDRGADLVVTRDPAVVDYVANRAEFTIFPLPWSRTYVLLQAPGSEPIAGISEVDSLRRSLARDVARPEARPADGPFWWRGPQSCRNVLVMEVIIARAPRVVYPRGDEVARGLAERMVALSSASQLRAVGLDAAGFVAALRRGSDRGYIVALPRQVAAPCHASQGLPSGAWIEPLIDTRAQVIVRKGAPPLAVEWDGTLRVLEP